MLPGRVLRFWQGKVEIVLRCSSMVFPFLTFLTAAICPGAMGSLDGDEQAYIDDTDDYPDGCDDASPPVPEDTGPLISISYAAGVMITLRCLGLTVFEEHFIVVVILDGLISMALVVVYLAFGAFSALGVAFWGQWQDFVDSLTYTDECKLGSVDNVYGSIAAVTVFCFLSIPMFVAVSIWVIVIYFKVPAVRYGPIST